MRSVPADRPKNWHRPNNVIDHNNKFCYMAVPKVASTSIKKRIADLAGINRTSLLEHVDKKTVLNSGYFSFTVIRHPFTRLVSGWLNKFQNNIDPPPAARYTYYGFKPGISFPDFISILIDTPDKDMDVHFRQMSYDLVLNNMVVPEFVGRFESLSEDWKVIRDLMVDRCGIDPGPIGHYRPGKTEQFVNEVLTPSIKKKIAARFQNDLEHFDYDENGF